VTRFLRLSLALIAPISFLAVAACASGAQMSALVPQAMRPHVTPQCTRDFSLSVTPSNANVTAGSSKTYQIGLTSLCGLAGSINVGTTRISPADNGNGPRPHQARYDLPLDANGKAAVAVTFSTTALTLKQTYTIAITAKDVSGGCCYGLTHTASVSLTVE